MSRRLRSQLAWQLRPNRHAAGGIDAYAPTRPSAVDLHEFLFRFTPAGIGFALAGQETLAAFLASDGQVTIDPDGSGPLFETPIAGPLPGDGASAAATSMSEGGPKVMPSVDAARVAAIVGVLVTALSLGAATSAGEDVAVWAPTKGILIAGASAGVRPRCTTDNQSA